MALVIKTKNRKEIDNLLREQLKKKAKSGNIKRHFGKLKRDIDGLAYQKEMRKDEE